MRKSTAITLGELESKLSGYVGLLQFRYSNLCVEADPVSLIPVTVEYDDDKFDIEQVADVAIPSEDQLQVYPKDPLLLLPIGKAIAEYHPEFKQEVVEDKDEDEENDKNKSHLQTAPKENDDNKSLLLTMPVVNKGRRDVLMDGVKVLYEQLKPTLDTNIQYYSQRVVAELAGASPSEIDDAKEAIEDIKKQHYDLAKTYREKKEKQIEDAYQRYLDKKTGLEKSEKEHEAATNKQATQSFKMPETEE